MKYHHWALLFGVGVPVIFLLVFVLVIYWRDEKKLAEQQHARSRPIGKRRRRRRAG